MDRVIDFKRIIKVEAQLAAQRSETPEVIAKAYQTAKENQDIEDAARFARKLRDYALSICDWTAVVDSPLTEGQKIQWAAYRQELRDIPEQPGFPLVIEWPESPV